MFRPQGGNGPGDNSGDLQIIETPDLYDFANGFDDIRNKDEFQDKLRELALKKGMKLQLPYGMKQGTFYVQCSGYCYNTVMTRDLPEPPPKPIIPNG